MVSTGIYFCVVMKTRKKPLVETSELFYKLFGRHIFYASDKFLPMCNKNVCLKFECSFFSSVCNEGIYLNHRDH